MNNPMPGSAIHNGEIIKLAERIDGLQHALLIRTNRVEAVVGRIYWGYGSAVEQSNPTPPIDNAFAELNMKLDSIFELFNRMDRSLDKLDSI